MITLTKHQHPMPFRYLNIVFLIHIDGVDIWHDPVDPLLPYWLSRGTFHEFVSRGEVLRGDDITVGKWSGTVINYLFAHLQLS